MIDYLTLKQTELLISVVPPAYRLFARVLAYTGCRVTEVLSIKAGDIDIRGGEIKVRALKSKNSKFKYIIVVEPITWILLCQEARQRRGRLFPWTRQRAWQVIQQAGKAIGIPDMRPHVFRHSFATNWVKSGGNLTLLQRQLGHANYNTTANMYLKYKTADIRDGAKRLSEAIKLARQEE